MRAYGLPDVDTKQRAGRVGEDECLHPTTMYGCNKLYCELLGTYYARHYKQLAAEPMSGRVDFRCVRFPGLISGGDDAVGRHVRLRAGDDPRRRAQGEPYACFVRPDTRIPFMAMPDGVEALLTLAAAPRERLHATAYNVGAFSPSAEEIRDVVRRAPFPARGSLGDRPQASAHRRLMARRRRRLRGAARLGLLSALRFRPRVQRVPDPDDQEATTRSASTVDYRQ